MASLAGLANLGTPKLANMDPADAAELRNYLYQMKEQIEYALTNIDTENLASDLAETLGV